MLTQKQQTVLKFISRCIEGRGYSPTLREIAAELKLSVATVQWHLKKLKEKGYLDHQPGAARSLIPSQKAKGIPIAGRIAAGGPTLAFEDIQGYLPASEYSGNVNNLFALRVKGDSMTGAGILDGDIVVLRKQATAQDGEIVAALLEDEATLKRLKKSKNGYFLKPENPKYQPIANKDFQILGRVIKVIRAY
ncbi:MAG: transcriptional repressor LexA [Elusimicrobia bacterium]|nr:transcriptional repressor LexA [Elusimicrobiota bacterium]